MLSSSWVKEQTSRSKGIFQRLQLMAESALEPTALFVTWCSAYHLVFCCCPWSESPDDILFLAEALKTGLNPFNY